MALAMGLNLAISRIGSVVNNVVSPAVANSTNVPFALFFGAMICGASVFCTMVIYPLDLAAEQRVKKENAKLAGRSATQPASKQASRPHSHPPTQPAIRSSVHPSYDPPAG